ncbi:MAG: hypothetical protein QOE06_1418 [Thermoleophilaceae bacterium]|jgi:hypothetical protein|nr:hypothetical protein [Thermoleophilaceae bacterium]
MVAPSPDTSTGLARATGDRWLWDTITENDPWNERADQPCLDRGQEYLSATGNAMQLRRGASAGDIVQARTNDEVQGGRN